MMVAQLNSLPLRTRGSMPDDIVRLELWIKQPPYPRQLEFVPSVVRREYLAFPMVIYHIPSNHTALKAGTFQYLMM